jgi:L-seryl-tRNA(Ser) seleniumtransferase
MVTVSVPDLSADELGHRLRMDEAGVFGRIEDDRVRLDLRTVSDAEVPAIAAAFGRIVP